MQRAYHTPVLVTEVVDALTPALRPRSDASARERRVLVDATCGGAGHTLAIIEATRPDTVIALDRDSDALAQAEGRLRPRAADLEFELHVSHTRFSGLTEVLDGLGIETVSAILADIGVSSHQLDEGARGFSFQEDAPLDMRMDRRSGPTAADAIAAMDERELSRILREFGEEPDARRIARAIVAARPKTTHGLATVVAGAMSARRRRALGMRVHPATRTFQALRIHVNDELGELRGLLEQAPGRLAPGGRLAIITFHSLEDRLVKRRFVALSRGPAADLPPGLPIPADELPRAPFAIPAGFRSGKTPTGDEIARNPRSRSSRVRVLERLAA